MDQNATTPIGKQSNYGCGCLLAIVAAMIIGAFIVGGNGSSSPGVPGKHLPTKAEWMQKATAVADRGYQMSGVLLVPVKTLYEAVGEPASTQTVGSDALLYWDCEDGQIQLVAPDGFLRTQGMIAGKINTN